MEGHTGQWVDEQYVSGYRKALLDLMNQIEAYHFTYKGKSITFSKNQREFIHEFLKRSYQQATECVDWGGYFEYLWHNHIKWSDDQPFNVGQYVDRQEEKGENKK